MLYLTAVAVALSIGLGVAFLLELSEARSTGLTRRLAQIELLGASADGPVQRRRKRNRRKEITRLLEELGGRLPMATRDQTSLRQFLVQAGYDARSSVAAFWGARIVITAALAFLGTLVAFAAEAGSALMFLFTSYCALVGWALPWIWVRGRRIRRQKEIRRSLPDALDFLVVCVEAGLGLNQALVRVAREMTPVSEALANELALTNLQIRAGTSRPEALRDLGDRTGLSDVQALVTTLIQTDRFGTSVARSLRVHSETLRQKRRQEAEEAAAKTTIKMVFPLVLCIFPALFVVLLAPGLIRIAEALGGF